MLTLTLTPLLGIGVCVSIQFGALEYTKRIFQAQNLARGVGGPDGTAFGSGQLFTAGVVAGIANGIVSCPVEHIRIRTSYHLPVPPATNTNIHLFLRLGLQTQSATNPIYKGPGDAISKIFREHGVAGIFKGQGVTFLREATGYGMYFLTYEKLVQREMREKNIRRDQISPLNAILYGALAGYAVSALCGLL